MKMLMSSYLDQTRQQQLALDPDWSCPWGTPPADHDAVEAVQRELLATPSVWAEWVDAHCHYSTEALDPATCELAVKPSVAQLLALLFAGPHRAANLARHEIVEMFRADHSALAHRLAAARGVAS
jgi:hypothetical protein